MNGCTGIDGELSVAPAGGWVSCTGRCTPPGTIDQSAEVAPPSSLRAYASSPTSSGTGRLRTGAAAARARLPTTACQRIGFEVPQPPTSPCDETARVAPPASVPLARPPRTVPLSVNFTVADWDVPGGKAYSPVAVKRPRRTGSPSVITMRSSSGGWAPLTSVFVQGATHGMLKRDTLPRANVKRTAWLGRRCAP